MGEQVPGAAALEDIEEEEGVEDLAGVGKTRSIGGLGRGEVRLKVGSFFIGEAGEICCSLVSVPC